MNDKEALQILKDHNLWRRGDLEENPHTSKQIGDAIDYAIEYMEYDLEQQRSLNVRGLL